MQFDRCGEPFEGTGAKRFRCEDPADEAQRCGGDDDGAWPGFGLDASRHVGRGADRKRFRALAASNFPNDDRAGVDTDTDLEVATVPSLELRPASADDFDDRERRAYGSLGVVLVSARVAEVRDHAVTEVLG
ncbi:MAG: hypothetical protein WBM47_07585, partial [Polyangiales bacterium]